VTHFRNDYAFDEPAFRRHVDWLLGFRPAMLFAAGGTGEFFSLALDEYENVVRAAVTETRDLVPVVAGCGYGTSMAKQFAAAAERAGASAVLLLPHYLIGAEQEGIEAHISAVCKSTELGVIVYNRDNSILGPGFARSTTIWSVTKTGLATSNFWRASAPGSATASSILAACQPTRHSRWRTRRPA
jgi:5-dehydro-4-deoxyglucarate dehydratase